MKRFLLALLVVPLAFASLQLVDIKFIPNAYPASKLVGNCTTNVVASAGFLRDTVDAVVYGKYVVEIQSSSDQKTVVEVKEKKGELYKLIVEMKVSGEYDRVAFDGKNVYLCGEGCIAINLKGKVLWKNGVSANTSTWTWIGLNGNHLYVPSKSGIAIIDTRTGKVIAVRDVHGRSASFCGSLAALTGKRWVAVYDIEKGKVLWNVTADWYPLYAIFTDDCKYTIVADVLSFYIVNQKGEAVAHKTFGSEVPIAMFACRLNKNLYGINVVTINARTFSDLFNVMEVLGGVPAIFYVFAFTPS